MKQSMKLTIFAGRNTKEVLRDPVNLFFGLGFPLILLCLLSVINMNIPPEAGNDMFSIQKLTPGTAIFGAAFMALFSGMLLAKDRTSSFLTRLFISPMTAVDFILGYTLPLIVMAVLQGVITFAAAILFGFQADVNALLALAVLIPVSIMFIGIGLLCGCFLSDKAVGGICGALLTNLAGWLSGIFFPLDLVGGIFKGIAQVLPFYHGVEAAKAALNGSYVDILPHLAVVLIYMLVFYVIAIFAFRYRASKG